MTFHLGGFKSSKDDAAFVFELRPVWRPTIAPGLFAAATVALGTVPTGGLVVVPALGPVDLAAGVALPLAFVFGPVAAVGVATGVVAGDALQSTLSWWTALDAVGYGGLASLGYCLWGRLPAVSTGDPPSLRSAGQWVEFAAVTALSSVIAALVLAWGTLLLWGGPFHAVVLPELGAVLVSATILSPIVLLPATLLAAPLPSYRKRRPIAIDGAAFLGGVVSPLCWLFGGTGLSLLYGGRRIQLVAGAVVLALLIATYLPRADGTDDRSLPLTPTDP